MGEGAFEHRMCVENVKKKKCQLSYKTFGEVYILLIL